MPGVQVEGLCELWSKIEVNAKGKAACDRFECLVEIINLAV